MSSMSFRLLTAIGLVAVCGVAAPAAAAPGLGQAGYSLAKVSASVPASEISQLAFRPGDTAHVYAARTSGVVTRHDYDSVTGRLTNALDVATAPGYAIHGLGFHGGDLYVSLNAPPAGARLSRFSAPDAAGPGTISCTPSPPARTGSISSRSSARRSTCASARPAGRATPRRRTCTR